jgi:Cytochrome C and Quinol oxidase polypeptide I
VVEEQEGKFCTPTNGESRERPSSGISPRGLPLKASKRLTSVIGRENIRPNPPMRFSQVPVQGLNLTSVHGHTALFGVYGMLGVGLMLFCWRALRPGLEWKNRPLAIAFWSINLGLAAMVLLSMLPVGLMQAWATVEFGTWYARSAEFLQTPLVTRLRWMRMFGDSLFAFGAACTRMVRPRSGHRALIRETGGDDESCSWVNDTAIAPRSFT